MRTTSHDTGWAHEGHEGPGARHHRRHPRGEHHEGPASGSPFGPGFGPGGGRHHHHGRGRRGRGGFGPGGPGGFGGPGWGPPFGFGPGFGRGPRVNRGDVRVALLALLTEEPMHGYQMIRELTERSGGAWRPSPGSVYPALQMLQDEGLVTVDETGGKRVFTLTDAGRAYAEAHAAEARPWDEAAQAEGGVGELRELTMQVMAAVRQVAHAGTATQVAAAQEALTGLRRTLYRILAEDEAGSTEQ